MKVEFETHNCEYCSRPSIKCASLNIFLEPLGAVEDDSPGEMTVLLCHRCYHKFYEGTISLKDILYRQEENVGHQRYAKRFDVNLNSCDNLPRVCHGARRTK